MVRLLVLATLAVAQAQAPKEFKAYEDFKKDMLNAGKGATNFSTFSQAWEKYQHFTEYLSKQGSDSPVGFHKFLTDYQQYMDFSHYMGKGLQQQGDSSTHFKDFLDFQKFLEYRSRGGAEPGVPKQFASFQADSPMVMAADKDSSGFGGYAGQFVPSDTTEGGPKGGLSGVTSDFKHYMDYSKYMSMFHKYTKKDWMSEWQQFQNQSMQQQNVPYNAKDCKTEEQLKQWRQKQTGIAKQWIPDDYQGPTLQSIDQDYNENLDRIKKGPQAVATSASDPNEFPLTLIKAPVASLKPAVAAAAPSTEGARKAQSVTELVAWRGRMGALTASLPKEEQAQWDHVFDGEMKAAFNRLKMGTRQGEEQATPQMLVEKAPKSGMLELSRTMLVFVVSFSIPVAGMYVYRAVKQASVGTDLDAAFLSLGEP